jgi:hypothetical protein
MHAQTNTSIQTYIEKEISHNYDKRNFCVMSLKFLFYNSEPYNLFKLLNGSISQLSIT